MIRYMVKKRWIAIVFLLLFVSGCSGGAKNMNLVGETGVNQFPQYLGLHISERDWYAGDPKSINNRVIEQMLKSIGTRGTADRRLAFSFSISYLNVPAKYPGPQTLTRALMTVLELSKENDLPIILHLDGVNWWEARPELWNWWDPSKPGYDPENVNNVEWYDWGAEHAVKIGWRNWGRQIRVKPQPNLASPAFLAAQDEMLSVLVPIIVDWYEELPENKKYLLGGVVLGWEVSPYTQAFYYPDGNSCLENCPDDPSHDPEQGIADSIPLGYAAASALGIEHSGPITQSDIDKICGFYIEHITSKARELGLPRNKLISHAIIFPSTKRGGEHTGTGALTQNAIPGWSFYNVAPTVADQLLDEIDNTPWAAIEFQPWNLSPDLFDIYFNHRNCRFVNIYNWDSIRSDNSAISAIKKALAKNPRGVLRTPSDLCVEVAGNDVAFSWKIGDLNDSVQLLISEKCEMDVAGILSVSESMRKDVTGKSECSMTLPSGEYYWMLVASCEVSKGAYHKVCTDVYSFRVN